MTAVARSTTVNTHPLAEILAKKLFGISSCPKAEQDRMVSRAIRAAVEWHQESIRSRSTE